MTNDAKKRFGDDKKNIEENTDGESPTKIFGSVVMPMMMSLVGMTMVMIVVMVPDCRMMMQMFCRGLRFAQGLFFSEWIDLNESTCFTSLGKKLRLGNNQLCWRLVLISSLFVKVLCAGLLLLPATAMAASVAPSVASAPTASVTPQVLAKWMAGAQNGYGPDQYRLGLAYAAGDGVPQNFQEAAHWWRKGAYNINPQAELMLGEAYAHGWGVPRDIDKAIHWWKAAARFGPPEVAQRAQLLLDSSV